MEAEHLRIFVKGELVEVLIKLSERRLWWSVVDV